MQDTISLQPLATLSSDQLRQQAEELLLTACPAPADAAPPRHRGRPFELPPSQLWMGLLVTLLRGMTCQRDVWRLLCCQGFGPFAPIPLTDQAIYDRLADANTSPLQALFQQISGCLHQLLAPYEDRQLAPFAQRVWALDETTLDKIGRFLHHLRPLDNSDPRLLAGKVAALFDVRLQQWVALRFSLDTVHHCQAVMWDLLAQVPAQTLLLFDLGYFSFAWLDSLTVRSIWYVCRLKIHTRTTIAHVFYQQGSTFDGLVWLGAEHSARTAYLVRLVCFQLDGQFYSYLTNVTDPSQLSLAEIARLYARRWDIELAFKLLKEHLHLQFIWSAKPLVIQNQVWASFLLAQLLHGLHVHLAAQLDLPDPFDLSLALLLKDLAPLLSQGIDVVDYLREHGERVGIIRPSTRLQVQAPFIPLQHIMTPPDDLVWVRTPRYPTYKKRPKSSSSPGSKSKPTQPSSSSP